MDAIPKGGLLVVEGTASGGGGNIAPPVPIIDTACGCDPCTSRTREMYDLPGICLNCGARFTVRSRKGDKPPLSIKCPACEVTGYGWRSRMTALIPFVAIGGFMVALAYVLENRHPRIERLAYSKRQWERRVAGFAVFAGVVLFAVVATWGQGTVR